MDYVESSSNPFTYEVVKSTGRDDENEKCDKIDGVCFLMKTYSPIVYLLDKLNKFVI